MEGGDEDQTATQNEMEIPSDDEGGVEHDGINESSIREKTSSRMQSSSYRSSLTSSNYTQSVKTSLHNLKSQAPKSAFSMKSNRTN